MVWNCHPHTGFSPSVTSCSKELRTASKPKISLQITTRTPEVPDFKFELLPLHSQLLRQSLLVSFPPLIDMLKFSGYPYLIRGQTLKNGGLRLEMIHPRAKHNVDYYARRYGQPRLGFSDRNGSSPLQCQYQVMDESRLEGFDDARTGMPSGMPGGAMCVQRFDDSRNSAIHTTYRISLRSSSMREPRDPLLKVFKVYSINIIRLRIRNAGFNGVSRGSTTWVGANAWFTAHGSNKYKYSEWV